MIVYELSNPSELKYGGALTQEESERCRTQTLLESPRWAPYPRRSCQVENICGRFLRRGNGSFLGPPELESELKGVSYRLDSPFGPQTELFHLAGHVTYRTTPGLPRSMIFKGLKGVGGLDSLRGDMAIGDDVQSVVHMGVVGSCLGARLQTEQDCYLENRVWNRAGVFGGGWLAVDPRTPDQCNVVRLSVVKWEHPTPSLPERLLPICNDIVLTGKGSLLHRFQWRGLVWNAETEAALVASCQRVADAVGVALG